MQLSDISTIIKSMVNRMPESSRTLLAHKFVHTLGQNLPDKARERWVDSGGVSKFFDDCGLESGLPWVEHNISLHDSELATFINRWMNVESFRRSEDDEYTPVTPDMNSIRVTMVEELKTLAKNDGN